MPAATLAPTPPLSTILTPGQLEVAAWYFVDGHTQQTIAGLLGIRRQSVHTRLVKIVRKLDKAGVPPPARRRAERPKVVHLVREDLVEGDDQE